MSNVFAVSFARARARGEGARLAQGEVLTLRWAQVDWFGGVLRLEPGTTKNEDGRVFPFRELPPLLAIMETQREHTRNVERSNGRIITHVFHRDGEPIRSLRTAWNAACRRAGVPNTIFHDLRRTAVRNLVRAGVPERTAMDLVGHKTRSIFDRYKIVNEADKREGVEKLARLHEQTTPQRSKVMPIQVAEA